jgi:hypothetical protein
MLSQKDKDFLKITQALEDRVKLLERRILILENRRNQDNISIANKVKEEVAKNELPPIINFYT